MGFYTDPYSKFGQLTYEMWRATRLVVDTGMHAFKWDRQRAIDYMKANTAKTEHDITVEVDRYIVWPGQALAYKMGELKLKELKARAKRELNDRFDIRKFHDAVLLSGRSRSTSSRAGSTPGSPGRRDCRRLTDRSVSRAFLSLSKQEA